jgi:hypothetical protein
VERWIHSYSILPLSPAASGPHPGIALLSFGLGSCPSGRGHEAAPRPSFPQSDPGRIRSEAAMKASRVALPECHARSAGPGGRSLAPAKAARPPKVGRHRGRRSRGGQRQKVRTLGRAQAGRQASESGGRERPPEPHARGRAERSDAEGETRLEPIVRRGRGGGKRARCWASLPRDRQRGQAKSLMIGPIERYTFNNDRSLHELFRPTAHPTDAKS